MALAARQSAGFNRGDAEDRKEPRRPSAVSASWGAHSLRGSRRSSAIFSAMILCAVARRTVSTACVTRLRPQRSAGAAQGVVTAPPTAPTPPPIAAPVAGRPPVTAAMPAPAPAPIRPPVTARVPGSSPHAARPSAMLPNSALSTNLRSIHTSIVGQTKTQASGKSGDRIVAAGGPPITPLLTAGGKAKPTAFPPPNAAAQR